MPYFLPMRKSWVIVASLLSLSLLASPLHAATPKAGMKCTKVGISSIVAGKKYTCVAFVLHISRVNYFLRQSFFWNGHNLNKLGQELKRDYLPSGTLKNS